MSSFTSFFFLSRRLALRVGDQPLSTARALRCLGLALGASPSRFAAFSVVDWTRSPWRTLAATRNLRPTDQPPKSSGEDSATTSPSRPANGHDAVEAFLKSRVSAWIPDATLDRLGLDSLDLAQMRSQANELNGGKPLPMALFAAPDRASTPSWTAWR